MSKIEQYQKADTYFVKAIEKNPDYAIVYLLLWNCNLDDTMEYLNKVLKLETCSNGGKLRCIEMLRIIEIQRYVFNIIVFYNYYTLQFLKEIICNYVFDLRKEYVMF